MTNPVRSRMTMRNCTPRAQARRTIRFFRTETLLFLALLWAGGLASAGPAHAQTATVRGFVTNAADGRPLAGATAALYEEDAETPRYGAVANADGIYLIGRIGPGSYLLRISHVGFETLQAALSLDVGDVRSVSAALQVDTAALDEVVVEEEREGGMADVEAGRQTIRPEDIARIPSPDVSADLASYLTTLPGIVTTGDQGGQFFVRGGEPTQNLVLLDGMLVYQPFHLLGFYSVFPAEIINRVDFYAGGFGSRYGTRLSSVIDVATRNGNNRRHVGMASLSPFTGALRLEGPLAPGRFSYLVSARESLIDQGAARYVRDDLPFRFGDAYAKVHGTLTPGAQLSLMALRTHDRGTIGRDLGGQLPEDITWRNEAVGLRALILPRIFPMVADLHLSHSRLTSHLGPSGDPIRASSVRSTRVALEATFPGSRMDVHAGWEAVFSYLDSELGGLYQNVADENRFIAPGAFHVEWDARLGRGIRLQAGSRMQFHNVRLDPYVEPRLRASWEFGIHRVSAAAGVYHQELVGVSDRRDAASVFTVWTSIPRNPTSIPHVIRITDRVDVPSSTVVFVDDVRTGKIGRAYHAILGYHGRPSPWLDVSVEGFFKEITNLFVAEWTANPRLTTGLQPAVGRSGGFEARVEVTRGPFYGFVTYGLSSTIYSATADAIELWYGTERLRYRPPHDRRHQVNALGSLSAAGFEFNVRWELGSGLPFTRPMGFDGFAPLTDVIDVFQLPRSRRVIYERPFLGRLPAYHRLDASLERTFRVPGAALTLQASVINLYDRRNLFYYDTFTRQRVDQLPIIPSLGFRLEVE